MTLEQRIEAAKIDPELRLHEKDELISRLQEGMAQPVSNGRGDELTLDEWHSGFRSFRFVRLPLWIGGTGSVNPVRAAR